MTSPYYSKDGIELYHGDARELVHRGACVVVTDPPFGIDYQSGHDGKLPRSIAGDVDTSVRDSVLQIYLGKDDGALVFGSWKRPRPDRTEMVLIWDTLGALGMGNLCLPWKPAHQEIYVISSRHGSTFTGSRSSDVLYFPPVQSMASNGRTHPHEKPVALMKELVGKVRQEFPIVDPFCGSGSTLLAAREMGRTAWGCEIEERYCEIAAKRLDQSLLPFATTETESA